MCTPCTPPLDPPLTTPPSLQHNETVIQNKGKMEKVFQICTERCVSPLLLFH